MKEDESIQLQKGVYNLPASISGLIIQLSNYDIVQLARFPVTFPSLLDIFVGGQMKEQFPNKLMANKGIRLYEICGIFNDHFK